MSASNGEQATLWGEIDALLARARRQCPLRHAEALLDLARLAADDDGRPLPARLAAALEGWDGRLLLPAPDDALVPAACAGDALVVDPAADLEGGHPVVALLGGRLAVRYLAWRGGTQWLAGPGGAAIPLGPEVAILGVVVEARRALARHDAYRDAA